MTDLSQERNNPDFISSIYPDSKSNYPTDNTIANKEQFTGLEKLFNEFYGWYVPKQIGAKNIRQLKDKKEVIKKIEREINNPHKKNIIKDSELKKLMGEDENGILSLLVNNMLNDHK
jgi:hypothetical protein